MRILMTFCAAAISLFLAGCDELLSTSTFTNEPFSLTVLHRVADGGIRKVRVSGYGIGRDIVMEDEDLVALNLIQHLPWQGSTATGPEPTVRLVCSGTMLRYTHFIRYSGLSCEKAAGAGIPPPASTLFA